MIRTIVYSKRAAAIAVAALAALGIVVALLTSHVLIIDVHHNWFGVAVKIGNHQCYAQWTGGLDYDC